MSATSNTVVVGVSGKDRSRSALSYAVSEAKRRRATVLLVHTWTLPPMADGAGASILPEIAAAEASVLVDATSLVNELAPGIRVRTELTQGSAGEALVRASKDAALVVVSRAPGHLSWLGHVLGRLGADSGCPVLSVAEGAAERSGDVVVGVDGSACSADAVEFAFAEADRTGSALLAVMAMQVGFDAYVPSPRHLEKLLDNCRRELSEAVAGWGEKYPDTEVRELACLSSPLTALQEAGQNARLIVVGSHGRGFLGRHVFGSVSSSLLRDAPCAVAVVRER